MSEPTWTIFDLAAQWRQAGFGAVVSLQRPDRGLHDVRLRGQPLDHAELLGLVLPNAVAQPDRVPVECHARGRDVIAQYPESADWPVWVEVVWRVVPEDPSRGIFAGVDVIASVRTALLESWPELAVGSRMVAEEAFTLADAATARFDSCGVLGADRVFESGGPGVFVARLARTPFSYAEMVHPADGQGSTVAGSRDQPALLRTRHRLFAERLEKGVLLRSRVRGVLLDRSNDLRVAAGCYAEFAAADPPLGT